MGVLTSVAEIIVTGNIGTAAGRSTKVEQIYHYTFRVPYNPAVLPSLQAVANAVTAGPATQMLTFIQSDYVWTSTQARWLDDVTVPYTLGSTTIGSSTISTARLPSDVTARFRFMTFTRGKSFKGGKSYRPIPESLVGDDTFTPAAQSILNGMVTSLTSALSPGGSAMYPCVVSRILSQLRTNPTNIVGDLFQTVAYNISLGTMKGKHRRAIP